MQGSDGNRGDGSSQESSGIIRAAIFGAILLLAVFGLIAFVVKVTSQPGNAVATVQEIKRFEAKSAEFTRLNAEWSQAKITLENLKGEQKSIALRASEMRAEETTQEALRKEAEAAFSRSVEAVSLATGRLDDAENEMNALLDDSLENQVANAAGNLDVFRANREKTDINNQSAKLELERIDLAVAQLNKASVAADAAAEATARVATVADEAQIAVDNNADVVPDTDGSTLINLRNDFFNEAKAQAGAADRSAKAAARALAVSSKNLKEVKAKAEYRQKAYELSVVNETAAEKELAELATRLKDLQEQRGAARRTTAIAKERLATEQKKLEQRKIALTQATVKNEELKTSFRALAKDLETQDVKIGAALEIYNDAQIKLRAAQKVRAKLLATQIAEINSEMHDMLRATLGNRWIENPNHDRFIVSSEELFESGSAKLGDAGKSLILDMAKVIMSVTSQMPDDASWILRVDGHTDATPLSGNGSFKDNWELSQARALAVVRSFIIQGNIPPERLAANGLGEYQPLTLGDSEQDKAQNRRIELVLVPR